MEGSYTLVGEMLATLLLQNREAPCFFAPSIVDYMKTLDVKNCNVDISDVPGMIGTQLSQLIDAATEEDYDSVLRKYINAICL